MENTARFCEKRNFMEDKMKTEFTYSFPQGVEIAPEEKKRILLRNGIEFRKSPNSFYKARIEKDCFIISAEEEKMDIDGHGTCINGMWGFNLESMSLVMASRLYENSFLPLPRGAIAEWDNYSKWRNGECYLGAVVLEEFECTITCLPTKETVRIDLEVKGGHDENDEYRKAFLEITWKVEETIKLTNSALQLIQAFRTKPENEGFINRSIKEIFGLIGKVIEG